MTIQSESRHKGFLIKQPANFTPNNQDT